MGSDDAKPKDATALALAVGENIVLRAWQPADAPVAWKLVNAERERLGQWLSWVDRTKSPADVASFIVASRQALTDGTGCDLALTVGGTVVGGVGLCDIAGGHGTLGYWISGAWQRLGMATKASRAVVAHGFGPLGLWRIEIWMIAGNGRSRALAERLGFVAEATLRHRQLHRDTWHDQVVYGILKDEFL
jgi:ribosomal-protein-serine acetyltransferase